MSKKVVTSNGTRHWGTFSEKEPHTDEQAETLAKTANQKAKELGLKVTYEVVED